MSKQLNKNWAEHLSLIFCRPLQSWTWAEEQVKGGKTKEHSRGGRTSISLQQACHMSLASRMHGVRLCFMILYKLYFIFVSFNLCATSSSTILAKSAAQVKAREGGLP